MTHNLQVSVRDANAAMAAFISAGGCSPDDVVGDLIADIRHWCDAMGVDFDHQWERAQEYYDEEVRESITPPPDVVATLRIERDEMMERLFDAEADFDERLTVPDDADRGYVAGKSS